MGRRNQRRVKAGEGAKRTVGLVLALSVVALAAHVAATEPPLRMGPPESPITVSSTKEIAKATATSAARSTSRLLGLPSVAPSRLVEARITDARPFGDPTSERVVWLAEYDSLVIPRRGPGVTRFWDNVPDTTITLDIRVAVDPQSGKVLLAYTPSRPEWVAPMYPRRDVEETLRDRGWSLGPAPADSIVSSVIEVMRVMRNNRGPAFRSAGQIVIRPRMVRNSRIKLLLDGELRPVEPARLVWLVELMGSVTERVGSGHDQYWTRVLSFIDDRTLRGIYGIPEP